LLLLGLFSVVTLFAHRHMAKSKNTVRQTAWYRKSHPTFSDALGEKDAIATHARLLSEKRVGFLILAFGLALYLTGLVLRSSEGVVVMAGFAVGVLALGLGATALWIKVGTKRVRQQTHEAARSEDSEISEQ
jgi:hypothetical protein